ncbi:MAG: leucine-rich repeat protein [Paludibacter sp.]
MKKLILLSLCLSLYLIGQAHVSKIRVENPVSSKQTIKGFKPTVVLHPESPFNETLMIPHHVRRSAVKPIQASVKSIRATVIKSVNITAGGLLAALTPTELNTVTNLTISGSIDARDFKILRDSLPLLAVLDLSAVNIQSYSGTAGTMSPLNINYSEKTIPNYAFCDSITYNSKISLTTITLPTSITTIGSTAFNGCSGLTGTLNIPSMVTTIGFSAFAYCGSLTAVNIPLSVITIGDYAFDACSGIISVEINNPNYSSTDGILFDKQKTKLIQCPTSKTGSYTIPSTVQTIGDWAFESCGLTSVVIPETVTSLLSGVFYYCTSLTSVNIPSSLTSIPEYTFFYCSSLSNITISNLVLSIGNQAFGYSGLTNVTIPNSVTSLGISSFYNCAKLNSVTLPNSVIKIGSRAFGYCSTLTEINVGSGNPAYSSLNGVLFNKNQNKLIQCPSGKQGSFIIPNTVDSLDNYSFHRCSVLSSLTIPGSVISIGNYAFYSCTGLTSISIPSSVSSLGAYALGYCTGLTSIYAYYSQPLVLSSTNIFYSINKTTCTLYVPYGTKVLYAAAAQWSDFTNIVELAPVSKTINITTAGTLATILTAEELNTINKLTITGTIDARDFKTMRDKMTVLSELDLSGVNISAYTGFDGPWGSGNTIYPANQIPADAFYNYNTGIGKESLTKIVLPLSTTSFGEAAFQNCYYLTGITIPNSVTSIGNYAFYNCSGIWGALVIPNSVTSIGNFAFAYCLSISSLTLSNTLTTIGGSAFFNCTSLLSITIPSTVNSIGFRAFNWCNALTQFIVESGNISYSSLDGVLFNKNQSSFIQFPGGKAGNYTIPSTVTSIESYAFYGCGNVTSISIPKSVNFIGSRALGYCNLLTSFTVASDSPYLSAVDGVLFNKTQSELIQCPSGKSGIYTVPNTVNIIREGGFIRCNKLTSVIIPNSVTAIETYVFYNCTELTSITIPNSIKSIGDYAFGNCSKLTSLTIPNSVSTIGNYAFSSCTGLTSIYVNSRPLVIPSTVFNGVNKTTSTLYVPYGSKILYAAANYWRNFTNIVENSQGFLLGSDKVSLTKNAGSSNVSIDANVAWTASSNQSWLTVSPVSGTGNNTLVLTAQANTSEISRMATVTISATGIASQTISVMQAGLPKSLNVTAGGLFSALSADQLAGIYDLTLTGTIDARDFKTMRDKMPLLSILNLSGVNIVAYNGTEGTMGTNSNSYLSNAIPDFAFSLPVTYIGKTSLKTIVMPTSLIAIGNTAFENCTGLTGVLIIPLSVTSIGNYAFFGCTNLSGTLTIPSLVTTIGNYAFNNCFNLTGTLIIPSLVTKIGDYTFGNCSGFNGILNIPSTVSSIGEYAFGFCNNLTSVNIPSSVNYIGIYAFDGCSGYFTVDVNNQNYSSSDGILFDKQKTLLIQCPTSIKGSYIISSTVNTIGVWAFENSSLTSVSIPTTVTSMGVGAFYNCSNLTSIYANATKPIDLSTLTYVFDGVDKTTCTLYVPADSKALYQAAPQWKDFLNILEMVSSYNVTVPSGTKACYIAGEMNNWTQQLMRKVDETHYTITINGAATSQKYKYCSGPAWIFVERTIDGKDVSNRTYSVNDIVESWANIYDPSVALTDIKYSVTVPLGTKKCYISGDMNYWSFTAMTKTDSIHYSITLPSNLTYTYKYCSGPSWDYVEMDASGNYLPNNRNYSANDVVANWKSIYSSIVNIESEKLNIYPNPFTEGFIINGLDGNANVTITDLNGRLLLNKQVYRQENISVGNLPKGLYFVKIRSNDFSVDKRILKR